MNRIVKMSIRIASIVLILMLGYQECCYADLIVPSLFYSTATTIVMLFFVIDIIVGLSYEIESFIIKRKIKEEKEKGNSDKTIEELEKKKSDIDKKSKKCFRIFLLLIVLSILLFIIEGIIQSQRHGPKLIIPAE